MATITRLLALSLFLTVLAMAGPATGFRKMVGGKTEVPDVETNQEVQELGRSCVKEYNRREQMRHAADDGEFNPLIFSRVVEAQRQVVAGSKYFLRIEVTVPGGSTRMFGSVVLVKPWLRSMELLDFAPVTNSFY